jgi:hypothetical protein
VRWRVATLVVSVGPSSVIRKHLSSDKDKKKYVAAGLGSVAASAGGGYAYGLQSGNRFMENEIPRILSGKYVNMSRKQHVKSVARSLGSAYKANAKTKGGKVALGVAGAGIAGAQLNASHAKRKGTIVRMKKSDTTSAFGIEH